MSTTTLRLALPTDRTTQGPRLKGDASQVTIEYDYQRDDGSIVWTSVVFDDVLMYEFRPAPCCIGEDVLDAAEVRVRAASERLKVLLERWQETIGWQEWQQKQGGAGRYKHFTMYFDDAGCVDVVAACCRTSIDIGGLPDGTI